MMHVHTKLQYEICHTRDDIAIRILFTFILATTDTKISSKHMHNLPNQLPEFSMSTL